MKQILHHKILGQGAPLFIVHGLFGSSDNWSSMAKELSTSYQVILVDLRNHGRSFHSDDFTMKLLAEDLYNLWEKLDLEVSNWLGHSLGGKAVMQLAQSFSDCVKNLIVVDILPKAYPRGHDLYFNAMLDFPIESVHSRSEADQILQEKISDQGIRLFLLKNLSRTTNGFEWKINLSSLYENYEEVTSALPIKNISAPTLFVAGGRSDYIVSEDTALMNRLFSKYQLKIIPEAGHWIHADSPKQIIQCIRDFLT